MIAKERLLFFACIFFGFSLVIGAYSNHFQNTFHFDDSHTIQNNLYIRNIANLPLFFTDAKTSSSLPPNQGYRPIVTASLAIDFWLGGGLKPESFHRSIFIGYLAQLILMFFLYLSLMNLAIQSHLNKWIALSATIFYGAHTANAETINYIISRSDSFSTLFIVAALLFYIQFHSSNLRNLCLFPLALGMLTKEAAVVSPALIFFLEYLFYKRDLKQSILASLPSAIICALLLILTFQMAPHWEAGGSSRLNYLLTQSWVIVRYIGTFILPIALSADTDIALIQTPANIKFLIGALLIAGLLILAYENSRSTKTAPIAFGILWFFITLSPTSSFLPLAEPMNDHRTFLPFVGLNLAVIWWLCVNLREEWKRFLIPIILILSLSHGYGTFQRNKVWHSEESLWLDVTQKSPNNGRGLMNYGLTQMEKGNLAAAAEYFERALPLVPNYPYLHVNLGVVYGALKRDMDAERYFQGALRLQPRLSETHSYYARWLNQKGRLEEARSLLLQALAISPADQVTRHELMQNYLLSGDRTKAIEVARETLKFDPTDNFALAIING